MIKATAAEPGVDVTNIRPPFIIEEVAAPAKIARSRAQYERARRNSEWLQTHWADLLPAARGKFVVVAGQEAFVAGTAKEAWALAEAAHADDDGVLVQYVQPQQGPRIYANHWALVTRHGSSRPRPRGSCFLH